MPRRLKSRGRRPGDLFAAVGTTRERELARYHTVIHLRTPTLLDEFGRENPLRVETPREAVEIDARIATIWARHPLRHLAGTPDAADGTAGCQRSWCTLAAPRPRRHEGGARWIRMISAQPERRR